MDIIERGVRVVAVGYRRGGRSIIESAGRDGTFVI